MWILLNFKEHLFYRTPPGDCFLRDNFEDMIYILYIFLVKVKNVKPVKRPDSHWIRVLDLCSSKLKNGFIRTNPFLLSNHCKMIIKSGLFTGFTFTRFYHFTLLPKQAENFLLWNVISLVSLFHLQYFFSVNFFVRQPLYAFPNIFVYFNLVLWPDVQKWIIKYLDWLL